MSTRFVCDWCLDEFDDRKQVASVDITIGTVAEKLHICAGCAPDHLEAEFPQPKAVAEGGSP